MSEYTKGPWMIATSCSWRRVMTESGEHVCTPTVQSDGQPDLYFPNGGADGPDALLISSAPDLLENLIGCMEALASRVPDCIEVECARAAVAKATAHQQANRRGE